MLSKIYLSIPFMNPICISLSWPQYDKITILARSIYSTSYLSVLEGRAGNRGHLVSPATRLDQRSYFSIEQTLIILGQLEKVQTWFE